MNVPNRLTILRILLVPLCLLLAGYGQYLPAAAVFALACIIPFQAMTKRGMLRTK